MIKYKQFYEDKEGGIVTTTIMGVNEDDAAASLLRFRTKNKIEGANLEACKEDIKNGSSKFRLKKTGEKMDHQPKMSLTKLIQGALATFSVIKGDIASQEEINRRSEICFDCKKIAVSTGCSTCSSSKNKAADFSRMLAIKYGKSFTTPTGTAYNMNGAVASGPISKFFCGFCGCSCLVLVLSKSRHFLKRENTDRPDHCWAKKGGKNWRD